ncbi:hypothetical protein G6F46_006150 [Rhizopus delemar]|nr:hypothetical protein G6F54_005353 [Rhizopus delemar]KAG1511745.1 hypothetical protein G6F53_005712 [Rhizopus delemar]KAG1555253.1 hypothetical protein G6F49_007321 [Rhizopus delemar]KAG1597258.1 hypothetical protein G6F47_007468 [Rhizopus delemar]KAG1615506.1 hypothetical protein G6F46_006150 [Rhizopus delemar]
MDSEDILVNEAKKLSTTSQAVTYDILEFIFDEDSKDKALFKVLLKEEDVEMHKAWPRMKTTPLIELVQALELKKCEMLQNGIEDVPILASNPKVAEMYKRLGAFLSKYKSGKLPRAFKIIPMLKNWDEIILLTDPQSWTPQAMYEASKLFVTFHTTHLQNFIRYVLLPYARKRIAKNNDYHLEYPIFLALHIVLLNSRAFTMGCLLPLCQSSECTAMEASVLACVIALHTKLRPVPIVWSLMTLPFSIPTTLFLLVALERKKRLPRTFYHPLAHYFIRAGNDISRLPYIWYQTAFAFVKYCGNELDKNELCRLMKIIRARKGHHTDIAIRLQTILMEHLPTNRPEEFDSISDEEDGLKVFDEEIISDSDIESTDESDVDDSCYGADDDDEDESDDGDEVFEMKNTAIYEGREGIDGMMID